MLNCLLLVLLVLMQLPKKEAGAGLAFGGGATDALFGAGSGNFLTKATKYGAIAFFALSIILAILQTKSYYHNSTAFQENVAQQQTAPTTDESATSPNETETPPPSVQGAVEAGTNLPLNLTMPSTNLPPAAAPSNAAAPPQK